MSISLGYSEESNDVLSVYSETDSVQFVSSAMNNCEERDDILFADSDTESIHSDADSMHSEVSGKLNHSEESNEMMLNHPDIESVENIRDINQQLDSVPIAKKKKRTKEEMMKMSEEKVKAKLERERLRAEQKQMRLEEKKLAAEEAIKKREEKSRKKLEQKKLIKELRLEKIKMKEEDKKQKIEEKRAAEEEALKKRKEQALKGMKYLLKLSTKYSDFFKEKITVKNSKSTTAKKPLQERNKFQPTINDMKEAVEVEEEENTESKVITDITKQLAFFDGGELRDYQIEGVQWMTNLFDNGINGILADEMGLGKTVQVIALIAHLMERKIAGPYLIVAPLSTIPNWEMEFERFAKRIPVVVFQGSESERRQLYSLIKRKHVINGVVVRPVVITTYQVPLLEQRFMDQIQWQYIIIDEGHRIKNHESQLSVILRSFNSANRLLLTGTPIHNNITELWSLLNFLMPHIFNHVDTFASLLMLEDVQDENKLIEQEEKTNFISTLHKVLEPFVLRRLKKDVLGDIVPKKEVNIFCPLTKLQHDLYNYVINRNMEMLLIHKNPPKIETLGSRRKKQRVNYHETIEISDDSDFEDTLLQTTDSKVNRKVEKQQLQFITRLTMANPMMMFKKIVDHPYLVHFPLDQTAEEKTLLINEDLISSSGKMMVLDQVLAKLKKDKHKVLIFSTLVITLDLIEELLIMRNYQYCRLDGAMKRENRRENIESFNNDPNVLAFLLSTRSGGLGLNLIGADTVIFYDRDWNPQVDIQAQDRCHRIGQTKPVMVYTLVAKNTIDSVILNTGYKKRLLEKLVIKDGKFHANKSQSIKIKDELKELQKLLTEEGTDFDNLTIPTDELNKLLDRSELWAQMKLDEKNKSSPTKTK